MATITARRARTSDDTMVPQAILPVRVTWMQSMASKMWMPFIGMGFMIVVAALVVEIVVPNSATDRFSLSTATR